MILTDELLEQYKNNPRKFSYDSGYHCASIDAWNEDHPKTFKKTDSKAYREGYRHGWAEQKAYMRSETLDITMIASEHIFHDLVKKELEHVTSETNELAKCPDSECEEYNIEWLKEIELIERQNRGNTKGIVKRVTKDGVVYNRTKVDDNVCVT